MSLVLMSSSASTAAKDQAPKRNWAWLVRPTLGLLLPVAARGVLGIGGLSWLVQRPAGAAALRHLQDLRRALGHGRTANPRAGDVDSRVRRFLCGVAAGTILGAITGYSALTHRLVDPTLQALRSIPSIAWVPLFILWFGIFEASKIILIAVGVFFPVYLGVMGAVISVDRKIVEVGRVFRLSGFEMVRRILLPAVLPAYVLSLRAGLGLGWMFVVAAEFLGASQGLGFLLIDGQQLGKPATIVAAIVAFAILGKTTDAILAVATAPLLRWEDRFART